MKKKKERKGSVTRYIQARISSALPTKTVAFRMETVWRGRGAVYCYQLEIFLEALKTFCSCIITSHRLFGEMPFDFAVDFFPL